ncbi:hypothetical protein P3339_00945 [Microbulbifer sp. MLAF003]|uniref:amidohydrolase family protein n=1 Tax=Microbulbifer sp. MLAF003 TaxID=3032582 RepID=UPI0024AD3ADC|nr:hypothetical protein [Microbulbifer sp. MLAF003]WHI51435.1 hypothetical protein P3339_00945 [Microbulbifer sp. MLAF003]
MTERCDLLITNVNAATMDPSIVGAYGAVEDAAVAVTGGKIVWLGPRRELPDCTPDEVIDGEGQWLTPGLIDCHTHLVYGGHRAGEFARRLGERAMKKWPAPVVALFLQCAPPVQPVPSSYIDYLNRAFMH